ncbi:MAG: hypothetical protein Q4E24_12825 [bacterium]|nr:hypothetical protein [bacterium]
MNIKPQNYNDIISIKYPFALEHPRMSMGNRAAQFSAFKALSGYNEEIDETARLTDAQFDLDESVLEGLDARLQFIKEKISLSEEPLIQIVYFIPDKNKPGGKYMNISTKVKKIDETSKSILTATGLNIPIKNICKIEGEFFE